MVVVAIGRNIGAQPMPLGQWDRFRKETATVLRALGNLQTAALGRFAGSAEWSAEDTALYVLDTALGSAEIQRAMSHLIARYKQDAIGIIAGDYSAITGG